MVIRCRDRKLLEALRSFFNKSHSGKVRQSVAMFKKRLGRFFFIFIYHVVPHVCSSLISLKLVLDRAAVAAWRLAQQDGPEFESTIWLHPLCGVCVFLPIFAWILSDSFYSSFLPQSQVILHSNYNFPTVRHYWLDLPDATVSACCNLQHYLT